VYLFWIVRFPEASIIGNRRCCLLCPGVQ